MFQDAPDDLPLPADLQATAVVDADHPDVIEFAKGRAGRGNDKERAVALALAVRDTIRYDPYRLDLTTHGMAASTALARGFGWCVPKATLLAAACRATGIPARLGFADVRNHLSTQRMRQHMNTDVFFWHGYTEIWLNGAWRKATPAFNLSLCERFGLIPLVFDGENDSIYHPFDRYGNRHMEYVRFRGSYSDLPLDEIIATFNAVYADGPLGSASSGELAASDFLADVEREVGPPRN